MTVFTVLGRRQKPCCLSYDPSTENRASNSPQAPSTNHTPGSSPAAVDGSRADSSTLESSRLPSTAGFRTAFRRRIMTDFQVSVDGFWLSTESLAGNLTVCHRPLDRCKYKTHWCLSAEIQKKRDAAMMLEELSCTYWSLIANHLGDIGSGTVS